MSPRKTTRLLAMSLIVLVLSAIAFWGCGGGGGSEKTPAASTPSGEVTPRGIPTQTASTPAGTQQAGVTVEVEIKDFEFVPDTVTIKVGDTVRWTNTGVTHTVTGGGFDSGSLAKGDSYSRTFKEEGTFEYSCTPHPFMKGKVIVEKGPGSASPGQ